MELYDIEGCAHGDSRDVLYRLIAEHSDSARAAHISEERACLFGSEAPWAPREHGADERGAQIDGNRDIVEPSEAAELDVGHRPRRRTPVSARTA
jgi:hypothetical protein